MGGGGEPPLNIWGEPNDRPHVVEGPCLGRFANAAVCGAAAGTFLGACQVAWYPDPVTSDAKHGGVIGKTDVRAVARTMARPAMWMMAAGSTFAAVECLAETFRQKKDSWNSVIGGMAAGVVIGATTKRFDLMTSTAIGMGLLLGAIDYSGPDSVHTPYELREKMHGTLPETHQESPALKELKEKYPKYENL